MPKNNERLLETCLQIKVAIAILMITIEGRRNPDMVRDISVIILSNMIDSNYHAVYGVVEKFVENKILRELKDAKGETLPRYRLTKNGKIILTTELREIYLRLYALFSRDSNNDAKLST